MTELSEGLLRLVVGLFGWFVVSVSVRPLVFPIQLSDRKAHPLLSSECL